MSFKAEIKAMRQHLLLSQSDLAKELGVATTTVNRWEMGKASPNISTMKSIRLFCEKCGYSYKDIESAWISFESSRT